jgi:hypothetical protein
VKHKAKYGMSAATITGIHNFSPPKKKKNRKKKLEELCGFHKHELHSPSRHEAYFDLNKDAFEFGNNVI